jgi:hypothetical protein
LPRCLQIAYNRAYVSERLQKSRAALR